MSDVMLYGVLRMPFKMAMSDEMSRYQFYQRVQEAATRLEAAEAELAALKSQPAPTEARKATDDMCRAAREKFGIGANYAEHIWIHMEANAPWASANASNNSSSSPQGSRLMELFTHTLGALALHDQAEAERIGKLCREAQSSGNSGELQPSGNTGELVQGEDSARLDAGIEVSYELMQDDMIVAGASGLGADRDIAHYAMVYGQDGPVECYRVERQKFDPFAAPHNHRSSHDVSLSGVISAVV